MSLILANAFGWIVANWRTVAILAAIGVIAIAAILFGRSCGKRTPKLDEAEIQKAQHAIQVEDRKAMVEILANSDAKEAVADAVSVNADAVKINTLTDSREKWSKATADELAAELERRK